MRLGGVGSDATVVGRGPVAFSGCLGQCASAHNLHAMECPREVLAMVLRELVRFGPSIRRHGELLLFLIHKKPTFVPDSGAFNSSIG